jgi:hypothetical protein
VLLETLDQERLLALWEEAAKKGRLSAFVPASGAATRMFAFLQRIRNKLDKVTLDKITTEFSEKNSDRRDLQVFMKSLRDLALFEPLAKVMDKAGISLKDRLKSEDYTEILDFLLEPQGLSYGLRPKALIPFHRYSDHSRTALEEHLVEAIHTVRDEGQRCRVHFTVTSEIQEEIKKHGLKAAEKYAEGYGVKYDLTFSTQSPATNTLAVDLENRPFRRPDGSLLFRPGGHGALLQNLNQYQEDVVFIKNIDNVVTDDHRAQVAHHQKILAGVLLEHQRAIFSYLRLLQSGSIKAGELQEVLDFLVHRLSVSPTENLLQCSEKEKGSRLSELLNRPLRVCGMIRNRGEPGGGPFWVQELSGRLSLQIVEYAQIDQSSPEQMAILNASTHFSPVQIVCGLRDFQNRPFNLTEFYDPQAVFISQKTEDGRELKALELPGLWNGSMAYWNTVFVEIPEETFNPVKTINDLLRRGHRDLPRGK